MKENHFTTKWHIVEICHGARGGVSKGRFPSRTGVRREFSPSAALWLLSCRNKKVTALPPDTGDVLKPYDFAGSIPIGRTPLVHVENYFIM